MSATTLDAMQDELGTQVADLPQLEREKTGLIEFHCVLVTRPCLEAMGGQFDERLLTTREHVDLCLSAAKVGFDVYLEPTACVSYGNEEPLTILDLRYFLFRWSEAATRSTIGAFEEKWQVKLDPGRQEIIRRRRQRARDEVIRNYRLLFPVRASRSLLGRVGAWRRRRQQVASA